MTGHSRGTMLLLAGIVVLAGCSAPSDEQALDAKQAVVDHIDPGTCYGMPGGVSDEMVRDQVREHPDLAAHIRDAYNVSDRREVYERMQQFQAVTVTPQDGGYSFSVRDGNCCEITTLEGTVERSGDGYEIQIDNRSAKTVPC